MSEQPTSLYGHQPEAPKAEAVGLMDQIAGVFTSPVELFQRLNKAPSWAWAFGTLLVIGSILAILWGLRVDVDEMLRPILEKNPQLGSSQIEGIIEFYKRMMAPLALFQTVIMMTALVFLSALIYWLVGKGTAEAAPPRYKQVLSAVTVSSLVRLPYMLLVGVICIVKPFGGLTPEKIPPTSVGYFVQVESVRLHALLYCVDIFFFAELFLLYLAARHTMRLKTIGSALCVTLTLVLGVGFRVLTAK